MNFAVSTAIDVYSIVLLFFIYIHAITSNDRGAIHQKLYIRMLEITSLMIVLDIFSRCEGNPETSYTAFNYWGNFFLYLLAPVVPSLWLTYTHYQIFQDEGKLKQLRFPILVILLINAVLTVLTQFYGWYYRIDSNNYFHLGRFFVLSPAIVLLPVVLSFYFLVKNYKEIERKYYYTLSFFPIPPLICYILQISGLKVSSVYVGLTISLLIAFIHIQNYSVYTDYLTGAYNRKKLETYMRGKIKGSTESNTFSAILVDIDNFKSINDTFGHDEGDSALETAVMLIKSCIRSSDIIARFGGDEFYIILNISDQRGLDATVQRILKCLVLYNQQGAKPYQLNFSLGYAVYDYAAHLSAEAFQKQIDQRMYENKRANKALAAV